MGVLTICHQIKKPSLQYEFFYKVRLSSGGLKKLAAKKHPSINTEDDSCSNFPDSDLVSTAKIKVVPWILKGFFGNSVY